MDIVYRIANEEDIAGMALIRWAEWGDKDYWHNRIAGYMNLHLHPQQALAQRVIFVAENAHIIVGFIAGHLTHRFDCDGELQWINVSADFRQRGIADELLKQLAQWFVRQNARCVCVNCAADNVIAQKFYRRHKATEIIEHWLLWEDINIILT